MRDDEGSDEDRRTKGKRRCDFADFKNSNFTRGVSNSVHKGTAMAIGKKEFAKWRYWGSHSADEGQWRNRDATRRCSVVFALGGVIGRNHNTERRL